MEVPGNDPQAVQSVDELRQLADRIMRSGIGSRAAWAAAVPRARLRHLRRMARKRGAVEAFLPNPRCARAWMLELLLDADLVACETQLELTLGQAR
jgi:hypothetical protein